MGVFQLAPCLRPDEPACLRAWPVSPPVSAACARSASVGSLMSHNPLVPPSVTMYIPTLKLAVVNGVQTLLNEFSDIFSECFSSMTPKNGVTHDIVTMAGPFTCCQRCLSPEKLEAVKS